jgi:hypothetical protein
MRPSIDCLIRALQQAVGSMHVSADRVLAYFNCVVAVAVEMNAQFWS